MAKNRGKRQFESVTPQGVESARLTSADFAQINERLSVTPLQVESVAIAEAGRGGAPACGVGPRLGACEAPPLLTGGESPQVTTSVKSLANRVPDFLKSDLDIPESIVLDRNQNPVVRPGVRLIEGQKVGIDWVSCVFEEVHAWRYYLNSDHLISMQSYQPTEHQEIAAFVKDLFAWVLGVRETDEMKSTEFAKGLNGYKYAVSLPLQAGIVHVGHMSKTVLVTVTGQGALIAKAGWETRLNWLLMGCQGHLTRLDFAYDDYEGEIYPVRKMRRQARRGCFQRNGRPPKIEVKGPWDQNDPDGMGLTLYIGSRVSGKYARIYEKGLQLGLEGSKWVRFEVEMHSSTFQLTLDMLVSPTKYFAGMYPCCEWIEVGGERSTMEYKARCAVATIEGSVKWIRHQAGGHLAFLRSIYGDEKLLDMLVRPEGIPVALSAAEHISNQFVPSVGFAEEPDTSEA